MLENQQEKNSASPRRQTSCEEKIPDEKKRKYDFCRFLQMSAEKMLLENGQKLKFE
jgi:hypothetical protein